MSTPTSKKPDGPRYDPDYPAEKLDLFDNLILLCPTHHGPVVDAEKGRASTAEDLEKMRDDHVANFDRLEALDGGLSDERCKWLDTPTGWLARRSH